MGKKRKTIASTLSSRRGYLFQKTPDESRGVSQEIGCKKPISSRNRSKLDGFIFGVGGSSGALPFISNKIFKKAPYSLTKCHPVGITSDSVISQFSHNKEIQKSVDAYYAADDKTTLCDADDKTTLCDADDNTYALINDLAETEELHEGKEDVHRPLLRPLFFEVPQAEEQQYVERDWIFTRIHSLFTSKKMTRGIIIFGNAGTGKTTIALQQVEHSCFGRKYSEQNESGNPPLSQLVSHIVAYHFCQVDNRTTCLVPDFVHSIAAQMCQAPGLTPYRDFLEQNPSIQDLLSTSNCMINPHKAFVCGIMEPLVYLRKSRILNGDYFILLLDSICEAESHKSSEGDTISSFISKHCLKVPTWFKIIITIRTCRMELVSLLPYTKLSLDGSNENTAQDIGRYISQRLNNLQKPENTRQYHKFDSTDLSNLKNHLGQISGGSFLFLKLTIDLIQHGHISIKSSNFKVLPISLSEVFMHHCNLRFPNQSAFNFVDSILSTCLAALNPLNLLEIYHSVNSLQFKENLPWVEFLRIFKNVQGLLVRRLDGTYMFFHSSFRDWLLGKDVRNSKFRCNAPVGHTAIVLRFLRVEHRPLTVPKILDLCHHILKSKIFNENGNNFNSKYLQAILLLSTCEQITGAFCSACNVFSTNLKISRLLLLAGASPHAKCVSSGMPILFVCAQEGNTGLITLLLEFGVDINLQDECGDTALHIAARIGNLQVVEFLIAQGASVFQMNSTLECPMVSAMLANHSDILSYFLTSDCIIAESESEVHISRNTAIQQCLLAGVKTQSCLKTLELLLKHVQSENKLNISKLIESDTLLTAACKLGHLDIVRLLLEYDANPNTPDEQGTPPFIHCFQKSYLNIARLLLEHSCNVDAKDEHQRTALIHAARFDDVASAELLLTHLANINSVDKDLMSPLSWACLRNNVAICKYLIQQCANIHQTDVHGRTPLHLAAFSGSEEIVQMLLEQNAILEQADFLGNSPLDQAIVCNHVGIVTIFLRNGAKLGAKTWEIAASKTDIMLIMLNKLLDDGRFLMKNQMIADGEHRFQYALRKILNIDTEKLRNFQNIRKEFLLEILKCRREKSDLQEFIKISNSILEIDPNCSELQGLLADAFSQKEEDVSNDKLG